MNFFKHVLKDQATLQIVGYSIMKYFEVMQEIFLRGVNQKMQNKDNILVLLFQPFQKGWLYKSRDDFKKQGKRGRVNKTFPRHPISSRIWSIKKHIMQMKEEMSCGGVITRGGRRAREGWGRGGGRRYEREAVEG